MKQFPRIFDCFTFSTELDLLAFRLDLLAHVVDQFVIVEAPRTHSGLDKPLIFEENRHRFERHLAQIVHIIVDDLPPPEPDRWVPENFQRNAILRGLLDADPDDIAVITDVDEIPDPEVLEQLRRESFETASLEMRISFYFANWELAETWGRARAARVSALSSPHDLRVAEPLLRVANAGCHIAYLMSPPDIARKYSWFAHAELDRPIDRASRYLESMVRLGLVAHTGEALAVHSRAELGPVQQALLAQSPEHFRFTPPPAALRRLGQKWRRLRSRPSVPARQVRRFDVSSGWRRPRWVPILSWQIVDRGDAILARLIDLAGRRRPRKGLAIEEQQ